MDDFATVEIPTEDTTIFARFGGNGPPLLLLHGFPQTHVMWRDVAPLLARQFTVVCADLTGYGRSGCPASGSDHARYAKRAMAQDLVGAMMHLGFPRFSVAGHDRGGRVAYRLALDHSQRVDRLAVLDIVPTSDAWERADARFAIGYWPWSLLAQDEPFPESLLASAAEAVIDNALDRWGSPRDVFPAEVRQIYVDALRDRAHAHAVCEEYRAAATIDWDHDRADRARGHGITCPSLLLWSARGPLDTWYRNEGGPLELWRPWCADLRGRSVDAGHFFPEEAAQETANALMQFFSAP